MKEGQSTFDRFEEELKEEIKEELKEELNHA